MGSCQSKCCGQRTHDLYDKYYPKSRFARPRYLLTLSLTGLSVMCLLRNEPVWPSQSLSALHLTGFALTTALPFWVALSESCIINGRVGGCCSSFGNTWKHHSDQSSFWTAYFTILSIGSCASLCSFLLLHPANTWSSELNRNFYIGCALITQTGASLINLCYFVPKCTQYSSAIEDFESNEKINNSETNDSTAATVERRNEMINTSALYKSLNRNFQIFHSASLISNLLVMGIGVYHGFKLAHKLRLF